MLSGVSTPLTFGMMAVEEFSNSQAIGNTGWAKLVTDLIFAGYCNEEILNRRNPALSYRDISAGVEDLLIEKSESIAEVYACFEQSKPGADLLGIVKKKLEVIQEKPRVAKERKQTGTKSKDSPTVS